MFTRPTLAELIDRTVTDLDSRLPGADARLRRSNLGVLSRVHAGAVHGLYGYLDFLSRQILPDTAESEYLDRWATIWGIDRKPAAAATGTITVTGTNGSTISLGTTWQRSDGALFSATAAATVSSGSAGVAVEAVVAGLAGDTATGSTLTLVNPVAGINAAATVAAPGLSGSSDIETDAAVLARLLSRIRQAPHGGASFDYIAWALEISGVTRAWCQPLWAGDGTVRVLFVRDNDAGSIFPDSGEVTAVQNHIDTLRPVTAALTVAAPTAKAINLVFSKLTPNTTDVQAAIMAEVKDLLFREASPGATILISHIREAISAAVGETDHALTSPTADIVCTANELAVWGSPTWPS